MKIKQAILLICCLSAFFFSANTIAKPLRVVSLNLCADQLLMALLPPEELVGITHLASDPEVSYLYQQAPRFHQHNGRIEEIVSLQAELIIAGAFSSQASRLLLENLGYRVVTLGLPSTIEGIFKQIRRLGKLLNRQDRANQLISQMNVKLTAIASTTNNKSNLRAVVYYANGFSAGKNTIANEILVLAGFKNIAAELNLDTIAPLSIESLLASEPDILIFGQLKENTDSLAHQVLRHRAIRRYATLQHVQKVVIPERYWSCAGPSTVAAITYLQQNSRKGLH